MPTPLRCTESAGWHAHVCNTLQTSSCALASRRWKTQSQEARTPHYIHKRERRTSKKTHSSCLEKPCQDAAAAAEAKHGATKQEFAIIEIQGKRRQSYPVDTVNSEERSGEDLKGNLDFLDSARSFVLPRGFPDTVSGDYLVYQLRTLPAHITGWMSKSLATSSLIHALGLGVGPSGTVAAGAAIKWITKDGLGALGRFLVGGRLGGVFDEDPRRWRMIAVGFATVGFAFEIATTAFPSYFILLASIGNFTKALGKGLSQPCFRIIQNHFAVDSNLGDISAKEEVWEVSAQLLGLFSSVILLRAIEVSGKPETILWIWLLIQVLHLALRYYSLKSLQFTELNQKRACILVSAHVAGRPVPGIEEANSGEPMLAGPSGLAPHVLAGVGIREAFGGCVPPLQELEELAALYTNENFWLIWRGGTGYALLAEEFTKSDMLRLLWQGAWLDAERVQDAHAADIAGSLGALDRNFPSFETSLQQMGWAAERSAYRLGDIRIQLQESLHHASPKTF